MPMRRACRAGSCRLLCLLDLVVLDDGIHCLEVLRCTEGMIGLRFPAEQVWDDSTPETRTTSSSSSSTSKPMVD